MIYCWPRLADRRCRGHARPGRPGHNILLPMASLPACFSPRHTYAAGRCAVLRSRLHHGRPPPSRLSIWARAARSPRHGDDKLSPVTNERDRGIKIQRRLHHNKFKLKSRRHCFESCTCWLDSVTLATTNIHKAAIPLETSSFGNYS